MPFTYSCKIEINYRKFLLEVLGPVHFKKKKKKVFENPLTECVVTILQKTDCH